MTTLVNFQDEAAKPECAYHIARNIYSKPRICERCDQEICNKRIPVEPNPGWLTTYSCTLTVKHEGIHKNNKIRQGWRLDGEDD